VVPRRGVPGGSTRTETKPRLPSGVTTISLGSTPTIVSGIAGAHHSVGEVALRQGDLGEALAQFKEALVEVDDPARVYDAAHVFAGVAAVAARLGLTREAATLWGVAERAEDEAGSPIQARDLYEDALGVLPEDALAEGRALPFEEAVEAARAVSAPARSRR